MFTSDDLPKASTQIGKSLERAGVTIIIEGYENIMANPKPCVFVANHMSTLETFFLPGIIQATKPVTYVIKRFLTSYPFLGSILLRLDAIAVDRKSPRQDLANILSLGAEQLKFGRSVIIFPQGTRTNVLAPEQFNSLAVKLAKRSEVQLAPIALKTDAWGTGFIKDIGFIRPEKTVHFKFGEPLTITGNGKEQHAESLRFIIENCERWVFEEEQARQLGR